MRDGISTILFKNGFFGCGPDSNLEKSYEIVAAKACKSSAEYLDNIYCCIIDYLRDDKFEQFYKDRKRILSVMQAVPTEHYWNELSSLNRIDALSCLTCLTDVEQKLSLK